MVLNHITRLRLEQTLLKLLMRLDRIDCVPGFYQYHLYLSITHFIYELHNRTPIQNFKFFVCNNLYIFLCKMRIEIKMGAQIQN